MSNTTARITTMASASSDTWERSEPERWWRICCGGWVWDLVAAEMIKLHRHLLATLGPAAPGKQIRTVRLRLPLSPGGW